MVFSNPISRLPESHHGVRRSWEPNQQDFFRNQFVGKTVEILKGLKVIKEPLPTDYLGVLEPAKAKRAGLTEDQIRTVKEKHFKDDIYALTGATISSRAVTNGVRDTVRKFV
jgi:electron transport complex protein RnfG